MGKGLSEGVVYVTPYGGEPGGELVVQPHEMTVAELPDGVIEVNDPLFDKPYRIGDGSFIKDLFAEEYIRQSWLHHGLHGSTRQLSNLEIHDTKRGSGRWSRGQHMIGSAAIAGLLEGSPEEIMQMATHDASHRFSSHRIDDLLQGRGLENVHDADRPSFLKRGGFLNRLIAAGIVDADGLIAGTQIPIEDVFSLDNMPEGAGNWPSKTGNLEFERLHYILHESGIWVQDQATVRQILKSVKREKESEAGDQLVFDDIEAATLLTKAQIRLYTEHWCDQVNDVIDEILTTADKFMLTCSEESMREMQEYHPSDALYVLAEDWYSKADEFKKSNNAAFMSGILKIAAKIASDQVKRHDEVNFNGSRYAGPMPPAWLKLQESMFRTHDKEQGVHLLTNHKTSTDYLVLQMKPGKVRGINPYVRDSRGRLFRAEELNPEITKFRAEQTQWCGILYDAQIDMGHPELGLSESERKAIRNNLAKVDQYWPSVLEKPLMPAEVFATRVRRAGERYRQIGAVCL